MTGNRLILQSRKSELEQLSGWIKHLASQKPISAKIQFAMNLCLEEAVSNIIRYGYNGEANHAIEIQFEDSSAGVFVLTVEDFARSFNPLEAPELPMPHSLEEGRVGGHGIRLLRGFADTVEYQATPGGNRLRIGFKMGETGAIETEKRI